MDIKKLEDICDKRADQILRTMQKGIYVDNDEIASLSKLVEEVRKTKEAETQPVKSKGQDIKRTISRYQRKITWKS